MRPYCHGSSIVKSLSRVSIGSRADGSSSRRIVEGFFFDAVIVRTSLATEAPYIIERLVAVPACPLGLQIGQAPGRRGTSLPGRVSTIVYLVCIIHDSAAIKRYWSGHARLAHGPGCRSPLCSCTAECIARSIVRTADELKSMAKKTPACFPQPTCRKRVRKKPAGLAGGGRISQPWKEH